MTHNGNKISIFQEVQKDRQQVYYSYRLQYVENIIFKNLNRETGQVVKQLEVVEKPEKLLPHLSSEKTSLCHVADCLSLEKTINVYYYSKSSSYICR